MRRYFLIILLVAAGGIGTAYYLGKLPTGGTPVAQRSVKTEAIAAETAPLVTVVKAHMREFQDTVMVSGSLVPREEILVAPEIEGLRVLELFADEGSHVKKGEVLARLVSDQLDAQMAQNAASLARSNAAIAQAKSQITEAEAQAKEAAAQLTRAEPLKQQGYLSGATYDQRKSAADTAAARVVAAKDGLNAAEAEKAQVEAQRRELDWRMSNTEVTSPADGVVSQRNARIGALATSAAQPMFRIIQNSEVELDAEVVETDLYKVKDGQPVRVSVPGYTDVHGKVRLVSPEVDRTTRLGHVRIFLGAQPQLKIGAFARGVIETGSSKGIALPTTAVTHGPDSASVLVVEGETVAKRIVKTGFTMGDEIEILDGVSLSDVVVARAGTFLRDGDKIRAMPVKNTAADKVSEIN